MLKVCGAPTADDIFLGELLAPGALACASMRQPRPCDVLIAKKRDDTLMRKKRQKRGIMWQE